MDFYLSIIFLNLLALAGYVAYVAWIARGLRMCTSRFNSTDGWTPSSPNDPPATDPPGAWRWAYLTSPAERYMRIITPHLEAGETLEGYAAFVFSPPRARDWGFTLGVAKYPLLMAVTRRRMLMFELTVFRTNVLRSCFIEYDAIQYLRPPKAGLFGMSGVMRFGLASGREYQLGFVGPIASEELIGQEQQLAAYIRWLAPRFPSSRPAHALTPEPTS